VEKARRGVEKAVAYGEQGTHHFPPGVLESIFSTTGRCGPATLPPGILQAAATSHPTTYLLTHKSPVGRLEAVFIGRTPASRRILRTMVSRSSSPSG